MGVGCERYCKGEGESDGERDCERACNGEGESEGCRLLLGRFGLASASASGVPAICIYCSLCCCYLYILLNCCLCADGKLK